MEAFMKRIWLRISGWQMLTLALCTVLFCSAMGETDRTCILEPHFTAGQSAETSERGAQKTSVTLPEFPVNSACVTIQGQEFRFTLSEWTESYGDSVEYTFVESLGSERTAVLKIRLPTRLNTGDCWSSEDQNTSLEEAETGKAIHFYYKDFQENEWKCYPAITLYLGLFTVTTKPYPDLSYSIQVIEGAKAGGDCVIRFSATLADFWEMSFCTKERVAITEGLIKVNTKGI